MSGRVRFEKIEAQDYNHAVGDKRKPTAYRVLLNGAEIGEVWSSSESYWLTTHTGVRYHFVGYSRSWEGRLTGDKWGQEYKYMRSRQQAAERLIEQAQRT